MSFDPMAAAIDWLDAYRAGDLDTILRMYADNAVTDCSCCVKEIVTDKVRLRTFLAERLKDCGASDLDDLQPIADGASVSYAAPNRVVHAILEFGTDGKIVRMRWSD
ncbi:MULTISPECIES: nuclear transport factor 2 family protein [unclassified Bradyrhizobium]|uniref:nuclear transport factor 2 family protein n=1 Tax=unclassified Bradyrhizobium TaxID=2631580 RepID=UPI0024791C39|nr:MULTISPECIES: nuclear transport factor 2 family protein [unclassified Bradyrhizobium]WGR73278.1 nuclear transport factor 2 family protein [Bradyrhizobium sp. ISRA426]WGR78115.1 nuclear transport factor 2 family protein [Bradyrhizobium sp. ISRA430]WGR88516.1 nuclear transport factor 2 family protein [Bradyrhizobium sp. ISRA432]